MFINSPSAIQFLLKLITGISISPHSLALICKGVLYRKVRVEALMLTDRSWALTREPCYMLFSWTQKYIPPKSRMLTIYEHSTSPLYSFYNFISEEKF